jgi:glyoxylase-like metal-dependent hydrolase (beta-lactamase superfamily II)
LSNSRIFLRVGSDMALNTLSKGCLSYLIASSDQGIVVDAGRHTEVYISLAKQLGVRIQHVLDTHLHADHISGGFALAEKTGAKYWMSAGESRGGPRAHLALQDGMRFEMGSIRTQVIALPGHTPGSVGLWVDEQYLICGDTLFVQGIGRPDLGGHAEEWARLLYRTLAGPLQALPDDTILLPTHFSDVQEITEAGYVAARLGDVMGTIEFSEQDEDAFVETILKRVTTTPPNYLSIVDINRGVLQVAEDEASMLEIGPNRCAVKA